MNEYRQPSIQSEINEIVNEPVRKDDIFETISSASLQPSNSTEIDKSTDFISKFKSGMQLESKTNQKSTNKSSTDEILEINEESISESKGIEILAKILPTKSVIKLQQQQQQLQPPEPAEPAEQTAEQKTLTKENNINNNNTARNHRIIDSKSRNFIEQVVRTNQKNSSEKLSRSERNSLNTSLQTVSKSNFTFLYFYYV